MNDERWEIESAFDELKTHLRSARRVLQMRPPHMEAITWRGRRDGVCHPDVVLASNRFPP